MNAVERWNGGTAERMSGHDETKPSSFDRRAEYERIARKRAITEREATRVSRRALFRASAECLISAAIGAIIIGAGWHTTDAEWGHICVLTGLIVGYGGITWALARAYRAGEARGDW
jgi:hypothetical protein